MSGDSNEYTQHTFFLIKKIIKKIYKIVLNICFLERYRKNFSGLKNEFESATINEPSVFECFIVFA